MTTRRITTTKALGHAFREQRKRLGWTQTELAAKSATPQATISEFERGLGNPTASTILALAAALRLELFVNGGDPDGAAFPWDQASS